MSREQELKNQMTSTVRHILWDPQIKLGESAVEVLHKNINKQLDKLDQIKEEGSGQ